MLYNKGGFQFLGVSFSIKALILILGLYLSYETRNTKLDRINDSKFVALSIYNIVVNKFPTL